MMISPDLLLPIIMSLPVLGAALIGLARKYPNIRESMTLLTGAVTFLLTLQLLPGIIDGVRPEYILAEPLPGLPLALRLEPLGMIFALIASFLWIVTSIYSIGYMRGAKEKNQTRFYIFFALAVSFTLGIAFSANLLTLFVFYEALTLSTYPLVTHKGTKEALKGGRTYLGILLTTSILFFLPAIIWTYHEAGTLDFVPGGVFTDQTSALTAGLLLMLFFFGAGKAALMPFHRWLPAAMVAPTPVSALLHAVAVVKAGVFVLLKIAVYIFGLDLLIEIPAHDFLLYVAGFSILFASFVAMTKNNLKARLAYSTVSQLGYITLGALLATHGGLVGGMMHIAMHAFAKITLFFCAGAIYVATKKTEISDMRGLGKAMPWTMTAFVIGSIGIIGIPPAGEAWSKWYLELGTMEDNQILLLVVLMISTLLNIWYLLSIPVYAFFAPETSNYKKVKEAPWPCLLAMAVAAVGCIIMFFYPDPVYILAEEAIR